MISIMLLRFTLSNIEVMYNRYNLRMDILFIDIILKLIFRIKVLYLVMDISP